MAGLIEGALAGALERNRERLNARIALARTGAGAIDIDDFSLHLGLVIAPAVEAVHAVDSTGVDRAAFALIDLSLELLRQKLIGVGARVPAVNDAWLSLLPRYARLLRHDARRIAGSITNAIINVSSFREAGTTQWIGAMSAAAPAVEDLETFLRAGRIAAWMAGLAHYRRSALDDCAAIPPRLAASLLGIEPDLDVMTTIDSMRRDPWFDPAAPAAERALRIVGHTGAFRGFGGSFITPPEVGLFGDRIIAGVGERRWQLFADRFGITVLPVMAGLEFERGEIRTIIDDLGHVTLGEQSGHPHGLEDPSSAAFSGGVLAVTLRHSHAIYVIGSIP